MLGRRFGGFGSSGIFLNRLLPRNAKGSDGTLDVTLWQRLRPAVDGLVILNSCISRERLAFPCAHCSLIRFKKRLRQKETRGRWPRLLARKSHAQWEERIIYNPARARASRGIEAIGVTLPSFASHGQANGRARPAQLRPLARRTPRGQPMRLPMPATGRARAGTG